MYGLISFSLTFLFGLIAGDAQEPLLVMQAEDGILVPSAAVVHDRGAQGGKAVVLTDPNVISEGGQKGELALNLVLQSQGLYFLWARVQWHCTCSRQILVEFASTQTDETYCGGLLMSSSLPKEWHWLRTGPFKLSGGKTIAKFRPQRHLGMIDCIELTQSSDYVPGHLLLEQAVYEHHDVIKITEGEADENTTVVHQISERQWQSFYLDLAMAIPPKHSFVGDCSYVGIRFGDGTIGNSRYEVRVRRDEDVLEAELVESRVNEEKLLNKALFGDNQTLWHTLSLECRDSEVLFVADGVPVFSRCDLMKSAGPISLVAKGLQTLAFQELHIKPLAAYETHFEAGNLSDWRILAGQWTRAVLDPLVPDDSVCIGGKQHEGEPPISLYVPPWNLSLPYSFETQIKLLKDSAAGVVFDVRDKRNFTALLLDRGHETRNQPGICVIEVRQGEYQVLSSQAFPLAEDQWHNCLVVLDTSRVALLVDEQHILSLPRDASLGSNASGLVVLGVGQAAFATAKVWQSGDSQQRDYLFEPETDAHFSAHWRQVSGTGYFLGHPAVLLLKSSDGRGSVSYEYKNPISANSSFTITVGSSRDSSSTGGFDSAKVDLSMPVSPLEPRLGFLLTPLRNGQSPLRISWDVKSLRDLQITRGNKTVTHKTTQQLPRDGGEQRISCSLVNGLLKAQTIGGVIAEVSIGDYVGVGDKVRLGVFGENLSSDDEIRLTRIQLEDLFVAGIQGVRNSSQP